VDDIANLQRTMDDIESNAHLLRADDLADFDPASIPHLYETRQASIHASSRNWAIAIGQASSGSASNTSSTRASTLWRPMRLS
jgi:hypothetical protein